ncbi:aldo/keto reductase [Luteimonas sp. MC1572]|uniref:aldo/keto reductase n=1 Tax=Luteimonas sp. MC1572 TaxID=2799325 RepID=UPI0018F0C40D|nr:aldo/keto reductase [Luteimonas sp. MC1572]MBJ6982689.1 aldo/keto reductase [Luteimonas sp. MC1572]QQO03931.1 aldo/keto reductase [Luteimonas sp. MC1572]
MPSRREFLSAASLAATGLALAPLVACSRDTGAGAGTPARGTAQGAAAAAGAMLARPIPSTGELLPVIGAGTSGSYEVPLASPEYSALKEVVRIFFEGGGSVIDTSPNYGNAEDVVGALLDEGGWRERCFLATKLAADTRPALEAQWADSLRRLRTGKVELLAIHNLRNLAEAMPFARELKAQGLVKYIGLTHFQDNRHADLLQAMTAEKPDFIQVNYSVGSPAAASTLLPAARDQGVAVMINRAFEDGKLFAEVGGRALPGWAAEAGVDSWAQMFLKFVISHPAVTVVIPATGKPERQADQLKAGHGALLTQAQQDEVVAIFI